MDIKGFKQFAEEKKFKKSVVDASVRSILDFNQFLQNSEKDIDTASYDDFYKYSAHLIRTRRNTPDNYLGILRYGYFTGKKDLIIGAMEVLDGSEVIENLSALLVREFNQNFRDEIFKGIKMPPLGMHPEKKPQYMRKLIQRLEKKINSERCARFLNQGLRDRYEEWRKPDREKYLKSENIDVFLKNRRGEFISELEKHCNEKTLFFTQEITQEVIEFVKNDPLIESGVRSGDVIIIKKIPHMTKHYLEETDTRKKRYFYCHCPWVKEAFLESDKPLSPVFCNCSAGYYKAYWEIVLAQPVEVEVLESLLNGDSICKFAVHLPHDVVPTTESRGS